MVMQSAPLSKSDKNNSDTSRPQYNDDPSPDSEPAPHSNLPELPLEVIGLIVGHMKEDKHSLTQWMRVSSYFHRVAAPLLYRDFTLMTPKITELSSVIAHPDATPFYQSELAVEGKIPSKEDNMRHTEMITVKGRFNWSTKLTKLHFARFSQTVDIPIMRIEIPRSYATGEWGAGIPQTPPEELPRSYPYLAIWERLRPKKIVIKGNKHNHSRPDADDIKCLPSGVECLIIHFDCEDIEEYAQRYHAIRTCPTLRKIVFIITNAPYICEATSAEEEDSRDSWLMSRNARFSGFCSMVRDCKAAAEDVEYRGEIIIVNYAGIGPSLTRYREIYFPANLEKKIQFLTMAEYLANHDTTGEFDFL